MILTWCTIRVLNNFLGISNTCQAQRLCLCGMINFIFRPIMMLDMLGTSNIKIYCGHCTYVGGNLVM